MASPSQGLFAPHILTLAWATLCTLCGPALLIFSLVAAKFPALQALFEHGKTRYHSTVGVSSVRRSLLDWPVPKAWFLHFYIVAFVSHGASVAVRFGKLRVEASEDSMSWLPQSVAVAYAFHIGRRLWESARVIDVGSEMHVAHYVFGLMYYTLMPDTLLEAAAHSSRSSSYGLALARWIAGLGLFIFASVHQHRCHGILRALRTGRAHNARRKVRYRVPRGDWFELVSSPHLLAEIVLYSGLVLLAAPAPRKFPGVWLALVTTVANLTYSALNSHAWYRLHFGDHYPKQRKALLPGLL
jgi:3-oxo-5-alpha-steroid 4-dehydrogenase 3